MFANSNEGALGKLLLRLTVGGLMLFHGVAKVMHPESISGIGKMLAGQGFPDWIAYGVYMGEIVAPVMIIIGLFTRMGGFIIAVNMLFAIGLAHLGDLTTLTQHGGWSLELQAFYLFGGLAIALLGSGRLAIKPD